MNIKDQENQLEFNLNLEIVTSIVLFLMFWGYIGFRLSKISSMSEPPLSIGINVPTIKQENLVLLRTSIKSISNSNLPVVRIEPFD